MVSPDKIATPRQPEKTKVSESEIILRRALKASPQDLWLDTIRRAKLSEHNGLIYWMLNQTECDFAIAVHAFYRSDPAHYLDSPKPLPTRPGPANIFARVLLNWDTGSYRSHKLLVEDADANPRQIARVQQKTMAHPKGALPFSIPRQFLEPDGGDPLYLPAHISPDEARHLWPLYADLKLDVPTSPPGIRRKFTKARDLLNRLRRRPYTR